MNIKKQSLIFVLLTFVLTTMLAVPTAFAETTYYEGVALKDKTHVYEATSRDSNKLKSYSEGSILKYRSHSSNWYEATVIINHNAHTGYIHKDDVENELNENQNFEGVALESSTHVFSRASTNSKALKSYSKGTILKYESFTANWYKATVILNHEPHTGYIHKDHVETATDEPISYKGIALEDPTNVYANASTNSKALKSYSSGSVLRFESYTSDWYKATVILNHKPYTGYIHKNHVDRLFDSSTNLKGVAKDYTTVYATPSESSNELKSYSAGSILHYQTYSNKWHKVTVILNHEPHTGYIPVNKVDDLVDEQEDLRGIAINGSTSTYERPSTDSKKVKTYSEGTVLIYKSLSSNWHEAINIVNGKQKKVYIPRDQVENAFKEQKNLNGIALKKSTKAYSQASRNSTVWKDYGKGTALKIKTFSENWYEATVIVNNKARNAYFHHDDVNTDILYQTTGYDYSFDYFVDIQMTRTPKANGAGTIDASRDQVEYYANPNNFDRGTEEYLQFLVLSQPTGVDASELNQKILYNKGTLAGTGNAFIQGARDYGVNELYLIAHAVHETGNGRSTLAQGVEYEGKTVYNMYGIHAFDSCPLECGAEKAYNEGWFTPEKAIIGGAKFIGQNYIARGQDTLYKMRWNPDNPGVHQYATHVRWAELQTALISDYYKLLDNYVQIYDIPRYNGMPGSSTEPSQPTNDDSNKDPVSYPSGTIGVTNSDGYNLNLREGTSTDHKIIDEIPHGSTIDILGTNGGEWLNVKYDGQEGWVHGNYVEIKNLVQTEDGGNINIRNAPAGEKTGDQASENTFYVVELDSNQNIIKEKATLDGTEYTWIKIHYGDGKTGWIADFVNVIK